ncbi:CDP-diacylglycerol--glycerol-3-phosphate 3-phosphatidyltransferase [Peredibacter sp. HCB2-198]|uniref:CDP-diacylglycerol--glycerol-3-phosphate 3-phosphatidyltransferase n=1 Tax=Peredibacter sp. HCB2-198 TaxID=3383025 RepID=UPI0038B6288D
MEKLENDLEIDNLPNRLTFFRMLMIPIVVLALYFTEDTPHWLMPYQGWLGHIACWIFVVASITDFLDGYIARKRNIVTVFGSFLDPIADKFLVVSALIMLMGLDRVHPIVVIILVLREMYMTSLRLLAMTEDVDVPVSNMGKWKTGTQMVATPMLMVYDDFLGIDTAFVGTILIYIAALLSLWSALKYSLSMVKKLQEKRAEKKRMKKEQKLTREAT